MKFQYLFEVHFIRVAAKTDIYQDFKLLLAVDPTKNSPSLKNKHFHTLHLGRDQRVINLKQLQPFSFSIDEQDKLIQCYNLQLRESTSQQLIEKILLPTHRMIKNFQSVGKTIHDQRHEGQNMNINFKVKIDKKQVDKDNLFTSMETSPRMSPHPSKQEGGQLRQTFSRARRPPQLNIKKKSILRESQKMKQELIKQSESIEKQTQQVKPLFKGLAELPSPKKQITVNVIEQKQRKVWQPLSAVPEALSAWLRKKVRNDTQIQQVKELLQSHHPVVEEQHKKPKLSIKLKIVIGLLIFGFFVLIMDMLKKETYRLVYGKYPKHPRPARSSKHKKAHQQTREKQKQRQKPKKQKQRQGVSQKKQKQKKKKQKPVHKKKKL